MNLTNDLLGFPAGLSAKMNSIQLFPANGFGSTNGQVRKFSGSIVYGNALSYVPSTIFGDKIIVNVTGIYAASYTDNQSSTGGFTGGIVKNMISTSFTGNPVPTLLSRGTAGTSGMASPSCWIGPCFAGDSIVAMSTAADSTNLTMLTVCLIYPCDVR